MNLSVHHVAVIVSDYAAAKHFYVDLLGLPVVSCETAGATACGSWTCAWATANWRYSTPASRPRGCRTRRPRVCAIWLSVWTAWLRRLQSSLQRALRAEPVRMDEYSRKPFTFFRDPDGLPLELHE